MKLTKIPAALVLTCAVLGCSSKDEPTSSSSSSGSSGASSGSSGSAGSSGSSGTTSGETVTELKAPKIGEVAKMMDALHVMWTNQDTTCESIEGERQATMADGSVMEKYKVVFTVPGESDNKHDMTATEDMTYTYRLRCKKGDKYSAYSNEMGGNPKK
jgi:hypothetical protein